jgi:hypothetical protein
MPAMPRRVARPQSSEAEDDLYATIQIDSVWVAGDELGTHSNPKRQSATILVDALE